jgi:hypothetical protein
VVAKGKYMGVMYQTACSCGYLSSELFVGLGMLGSDSRRDLARCEHCQIIVTTPSASDRHRCPECRRKLEIIALDEEKMGGSIMLDCPQCGSPDMVLHHVGMWD